MSPSIRSLFADPGDEVGDDETDIDLDHLMELSVDASRASSKLREPGLEQMFSDGEGGSGSHSPEPAGGQAPEPDEESEEQAPHTEPALAEEEPPGDEAPLPDTTVAAERPLADPLGLLPPERRAQLLALDQITQADPAALERMLAAVRAPAPSAPVAPTMPEEFEPGSPAARLWEENQATRAELARLGAGQAETQRVLAQQAAGAAANDAGMTFSARYAGKINESDLLEIAQSAAASGLAGRLTMGADGRPLSGPELTAGYLQALETTLWSNEAFRQKVIDPAVPNPATAQADADKAEAPTRKRKLTALSSAASPSNAPAPKRSPLETRPDGRLTPKSRMTAVAEIAGQLARSNEGTY